MFSFIKSYFLVKTFYLAILCLLNLKEYFVKVPWSRWSLNYQLWLTKVLSVQHTYVCLQCVRSRSTFLHNHFVPFFCYCWVLTVLNKLYCKWRIYYLYIRVKRVFNWVQRCTLNINCILSTYLYIDPSVMKESLTVFIGKMCSIH